MTTSDLDHMPDDGLPEAYRTELKNRYGPIPSVPRETDNAILADARQHLTTHRPSVGRQNGWSSWRWVAIGTTVAAAAVMCVVWLPGDQSQSGSVATDASSMRENDVNSDVDQNGRIDILDAFAMARQIRSGGERIRDINSDGRFDELDVDLVARRAVML